MNNERATPKVVFFHPFIPEYRIPFFVALERELGEQNISIIFHRFGLRDGRLETSNFLKSEIFIFDPLFIDLYLFKWFSSRIISRLRHYDIIIIPSDFKFISYLYILVIGKIFNKKIIVEGQYGKKFRHLRNLIYRYVDGLLFYTSNELLSFTSRRRQPYPVAKAWNNGVEVDDRNTSTDESLLGKTFDIVFIGRLTKKSKLHLLIEAISTSTLSCAVIGDGPDIQRYVKLAESKSDTARIEFFGEVVDSRLRSAILNSAKIFVYPGDVGLSLIHALHHGLVPVVHNGQTHMPEIEALKLLEHPVFFDEGSVKSLKASILKALRISQSKDFPRNELSQVARKEYNTSRMARTVADLIFEIY